MPLRIVEIGDKPFIKSAFPDETSFFSTYAEKPVTDPHAGIFNISPSTIPTLRRLLADPALSLIVCHPTASAPWGPRAISRAVFSRRLLAGEFRLLRAFGPQFLRGPRTAPLVVLDQDDFPLVSRSNLFLLKRCQLYFKRELPVDRWRVFLGTAHPALPTLRFRSAATWERLIEKLRPISLGLPLRADQDYPQSADKTADIFFAGRVEGSSFVRKLGWSELAGLADVGIRVDAPSAPLSRDEFYRRCASSWLTWSPEGYGWDCFRHYEALACGSVPLINYPTIARHRPLVDGEHALFYAPEPGALGRAIVAALADRERLAGLAAAGRAHVMAHHTPTQVARHIVAEGLALGRAGS